MTIKPIETTYNGYKFRSRLEARWAVFFDELGIEYQYEPEGFDLDGIWYLPDFLVMHPVFFPVKCFIEIKAGPPTQQELDKIDLLNRLTRTWAFIFYGEVGYKGGAISFGWSRCICPDHPGFHPSIRESGFYFTQDRFPSVTLDLDKIDKAYLMARQARFGKNGRG